MEDTKKQQVPPVEVVPNEEKAKELIVLLSEMSEGDEYFGATKLNKLLFFTDFLAYIQQGKSVSGFKYEAQPEGPMLKNFYAIRDQLQISQDIAVAKRNFMGYPQHKTLALRPPDVSKFSAEEMRIISHVVTEYQHMSASQISALSHEFLGWQAIDIGEEIPYEIALVSTEDLTEEEWEFPEKFTLDFGKLGIKEADIVAHDSQNV
jgi:uncharacterized phage-associated protein